MTLRNLKVSVCPLRGQGRSSERSGLFIGVDEHYRRPGEPLDAPELISDAEAGSEVFEFEASRQVVHLPLGHALEVLEVDEDLVRAHHGIWPVRRQFEHGAQVRARQRLREEGCYGLLLDLVDVKRAP